MWQYHSFIQSIVIGFALLGLPGKGMAAPGAFLLASRDTVHETATLEGRARSELTLFNRGERAVRLDSIEIGLDRKRFRSVSLDFSVVSMTDQGWNHEKIFYWSERDGQAWMSGPVVVPARDSVRIFRIRLDRCPKCNVRATADSPQSAEVSARVTLRSKTSPRDSVSFVVHGLYLQR